MMIKSAIKQHPVGFPIIRIGKGSSSPAIPVEQFKTQGVLTITYDGKKTTDLIPGKEYNIYHDRFDGPYIFGSGNPSELIRLKNLQQSPDLNSFTISKIKQVSRPNVGNYEKELK